MEFVVDKLIEFSGSKDEELRDISGLGASLHLSVFALSSLIGFYSTQDNHFGTTTRRHRCTKGMREAHPEVALAGCYCDAFPLCVA